MGAGRNGGVVRLLAALTAVVLVGGCGTRRSDTAIEAAASRVLAAPGASATPVPGAPGDALPGAAAATEAQADPGAAPASAAAGTSGASGTPLAGGGTAAKTQGPSSGTGSTGAGGTVGASSGAAVGGGSTGAGAAGVFPATPGATPGQAPAATKPLITVGNVGDYSGIVGSVLKQGATMAQVIARHINDNGGLNGHPVKVLVGDAAGDPARGLSIVRDMVESKGATVFMANMWVLSASGARAYLEEKKIPVVGGDVASAVWFKSPMFFPQGASFETLSVGSLKTMADLGHKKVAIAYCAEVEACKIYHDAAAARAQSVGATVVYSAQVSLAQPDYTAECLQAQRSGAEALMLGVESTALTRFARSCKQQGFTPPLVTASLSMISSTAKDPNLDGILAPVATFPFVADDLPAVKEYKAAIARYAPGLDEGGTTSAVWVAGALLREASKALPDQPTSADFLKGLWQIKNNNLGGLAPPLTFRENQPSPDNTCYFTQSISGGKFTAPIGSKLTCL
ncbi:MAG TPA: ABC transporter substrate-binding protein [Acidimicrobiia bacterium]|nr:ABC transporter substrate-binding protein [Acidimicrobiia bacterium]